MKRPESFLLGMLLATSLLLVAATPRVAQACSCVGGLTPEQYLQGADVVFVGTVTDIVEPNDPHSSLAPRLVSLNVSSVLKGSPGEAAVVKTAFSGGSCGYEFQVGGEYKVYAYQRSGQLETSICSGPELVNAPSSQAATPTSPAVTSAFTRSSMILIVLLFAITVAVFAVFYSSRRRRLGPPP